MDSRGKSSGSIRLAIALTLLQLVPGSVDSYPTFGTKRFQQHNSPHHLQEQQYVAPPVQMFAPLQSYGDDSGYYADDPSNYLYYAPHDPRYHSYGVPSYHGDYKPTQYLYAQGPTYRYYEGKEAATNPLDDLHEEMLEEDEREREEKLHQREQQMRHQYGQQKHYQQQHLITDDYPDQHRKQQQQPKQQKHQAQSFYYQPVYEQPQQEHRQEFDYGDEQEMGNANNNNNEQQMLLMMDPSYAHQAQAKAAFLNDLIAYNRQISTESGANDRKSARGSASHRDVNPPKDYNTNWNFDYPAGAAAEQEDEGEEWNQEAFDYDGSPMYPMDTLSTSTLGRHKSDDKAVRELQALTHNRDKSSSSSSAPLSPSGLRKVEPKSDDFWSGGISSSDLDRDNEFNNNYEYDDGGDEWINWDSKRSGGVEVKPISIMTFSDRKPSKLVITKVPENHFVLDGEEEATTSATSSATGKQSEKGDKTEAHATSSTSSRTTPKSGQKEEVLMRPAPPVRHPFSAPVMKMLEQQENLKTNKYEEELENKKRSSGNEQRKAPKATVYDTIKQLLDMEEHLQQQHVSLPLQKFSCLSLLNILF